MASHGEVCGAFIRWEDQVLLEKLRTEPKGDLLGVSLDAKLAQVYRVEDYGCAMCAIARLRREHPRKRKVWAVYAGESSQFTRRVVLP